MKVRLIRFAIGITTGAILLAGAVGPALALTTPAGNNPTAPDNGFRTAGAVSQVCTVVPSVPPCDNDAP